MCVIVYNFMMVLQLIVKWVVSVANWRVKETERMVAICTELQKVSESYT